MMDAEVAAWRRQQRTRLLAQRQEITAEARAAATARIAARLDMVCERLKPSIVGLYWPIRNELNFLSWAHTFEQRAGVTLCLPVVVTPNAPLEYWRWTQGDAMRPGVWRIPVPAERHVLMPDLVLAPLVGFDLARYRLGYGGGYFDRTLASSEHRPAAIGVGYDFSVLDSIFPCSHDIPMTAIVTEHRVLSPPEWNDHAV